MVCLSLDDSEPMLVATGDKKDVNQPERAGYRDYVASARHDKVVAHYTAMHHNQTYEFARGKLEEYSKLNRAKMTIWQAVEYLDTLVDDSDPDNSVPNSFHDFQTAEAIRLAHPDKEWLHLTGFLHDIGKMLCSFGEPQWAVVGDTFAVGCKFSDKCVLSDSFSANPDRQNPALSTEYGVYKPGCGLDKLVLAWGHDEYMYRVLVGNGCTLPEEALYCIRFHSFYPWHREGAYKWAEDDTDRRLMPWVLEFNKFDLYSKRDALPDCAALRPYYQSLCEKYGIGGVLNW